MARIKDGNWELISHDFALGRTVWSYYDGQQNHYRIDYQVDQVLKDNAADRSDHAGAKWGDGRRVASIPLNVYYDRLAQAHDQGDDAYVSRWLNDSDNRGFRTFDGTV